MPPPRPPPDRSRAACVRSARRPRGSRPPQLLEIESLRLLQGQRELRIRHGNEVYRLRHTRNDKLILTK